eukprot:gene25311-30565_t
MTEVRVRQACIHNQAEELEVLIKSRANVCSVDEWGLTALHYAVWNGHIDCVKLLVFNDKGVDAKGQKTSCLNMKSFIGLTALHLAAMDCPKAKVKDITTLLILTGADPRVADNRGRSAYSMAKECSNEGFLEAVQEYIDVRNGTKDASEMKDFFDGLVAKYRFFSSERPRQTDADFLASLPFQAPDFLHLVERVGQLPPELSIHEHNIVPLAKHGFEQMKGVESLRCLKYAEEQAEANRQRREKLALAQEQDKKDSTQQAV